MTLIKHLLFVILISITNHAVATDWEYSGHAKLLLDHNLFRSDDLIPVITGDTEIGDANANLRLNLKRQWQSWDVNIHYQLAGMAGESSSLPASANPLTAGTPGSDDGRLFNLAGVVSDTANSRWVQRLDRLNAGYTTGNWVMRIGRQAISWGNGITFHPLDIFNPFSPLSLDTEYKIGDDLLYLQWLLVDDADLQFIYLPRRDQITGELDSRQDSLALKLHIMSAQGDWDLLAARHYDETVLGLGYVRSIEGAVWRSDINMTQLSDGRDAWFVDSNLDYSWNWLKHNFYGYIEWFHNSLGQRDVDFASIDPALLSRMQRGEMYSLAKNVISLGTMMELTPRWQANLGLLHHPDEGDSFMSLSFNHDWKQNASLIMGLRLPNGARGTEFGGLYLSTPDGDGFASSATQLFVYVQYYY